MGSVRIGTFASLAVMIVACGGTDETTPAPSPGGPPVNGQGACNGAAIDFAPSNVTIARDQSSALGDVVIADDACVIDTELGTISCVKGDAAKVMPFTYAKVTQGDGTAAAVFTACSFRIESAAQLRAKGQFPLVLVALDGIDVNGLVSVASTGQTAVAGGFSAPATSTKTKGLGPGGGGAATDTSGSGGGGYCGGGGAGGANAAPAAPGGTTYGTAEIVPLIGGSSGGESGGGGAGGGAIQLVAGRRVSITTSGVIHAGGGGGGTSSGGGSGGAVLIEAPDVTVSGTLAANGGGGGGSNGGAEASDATPDRQAAVGGGQGKPGPGGNGAADERIEGLPGTYPNVEPNWPAAGGGGAGRIRINSRSGAAALTGTISPSPKTPCATQGTLR